MTINRCSGAPDCGGTGCPLYRPHKCKGWTCSDGDRHQCRTAGKTVHCEPQMMICPKADRCELKCDQKTSHPLTKSCSWENAEFCPGCVPVEQPEMMICRGAGGHDDCSVCLHATAHPRDAGCAKYSACPTCTPIEHPVQELSAEIKRLHQEHLGYDWHIRRLITEVQAFINHYNHPDLCRAPSTDELEVTKTIWQAADDFTVRIWKGRK